MQQKAKVITAAIEPATPPALSHSQSSYLIDETQTRINANMKKLSDLEPTLKDYHNAYLTLKNEHDTYVDKIAADKQLLEVLSKVQNGIPMTTSLKVIRAESHNEMKPREKRKYSLSKDGEKHNVIPWTAYAVELLTVERKFMKPDDLYTKAIKKYKVEEEYERRGKEFRAGYLKWGVINNCWLGNCAMSVKGSIRGRLVHVEGRIGLRDWVTDDMKLRPEFVVQH